MRLEGEGGFCLSGFGNAGSHRDIAIALTIARCATSLDSHVAAGQCG